MRTVEIGVIVLALAGLAMGGCIEKVKPGAAGAENSSGGAMSGAPAPMPPASGESGSPAAPSAASPVAGASEEAKPSGEAVKLAGKADALEAELKAKPNDPALKKQLAEAYFKEGYAIEYDDNLPPRQKYGPALKLFNKALAMDPTHKAAAENKATIESIYKSMGRPIPQ